MDKPLNSPGFSSFLALLSIGIFFADLVMDVTAVVSLFNDRNYVSMGVLIALLLVSSIIVQLFSWIWYSDPDKILETRVETFMSKNGLIGVLHILQLGMLLRMAGVMEINIRNLLQRDRFQKGEVVFKNHEMSMLRLFETGMESAPQVILKIYSTVQEQEQDPFTIIEIVVPVVIISFSVFFNQDVCRVSLVERKKKISSAVFFLWNLLLIPPRVVAVALFASVLTCYITVHFLIVWSLLFLWAWRQKTDVMENKKGEFLYRATLRVIWYFSCFSGTRQMSNAKRNIYDIFILLDTMLLLGLWFWKRSVESARLSPLLVSPYVLLGVLAALHFTGFLLKQLYYWKFHPKCPCFRFDVGDEMPQNPPQRRPARMDYLEQGETGSSAILEPETEPQSRVTGAERRMRKMAVNFYW